MKPIYILPFCLFLLGKYTSNAQNKIQLFNQKDLTNWYAFEPETGKHNDASEIFSVENKQIRMYGKKAGYLMSKESFKNFKLTVVFRWNTDTTFVRKNDKRNSGVMYLVPNETPDELWPKGIQFQIKDGANGDFVLLQNVTLSINDKTTAPGKSVVVKSFREAIKPDAEWNTLVIKCKKGRILQKLNGKTVNKGCNASVTEGRILLQYEGFPIDFRSVELQKLN